MLTTLAAGPAGGCGPGHGAAGRVTFSGGTVQALIWQHGRAPTPGIEDNLQIEDELDLGTIGDVLAAGDDLIAETVILWLRDVIHTKPDRGLGWTRCREHHSCGWETRRELGICWQHMAPTQREIDFGSVGTLLDRPLNHGVPSGEPYA